MKDELNGSLIIVLDQQNPDGAARIGIIGKISIDTNKVDVTFGNLHQESVDVNNVHFLKDRSNLYSYLLSNTSDINLGDFKTLFKINMLQDRGDPASILEAYHLLQKNPSAINSATDSLSNFQRSKQLLNTEAPKVFSR
ncbi:hypothetical protein [Pedobacter agri]|uniref:hypothetical protein n=1 Tax=Pedobacter agri TaxID=454586 RepID=UPI00292F07CE|nr:hypothetical protein [Pedobacter agri]